MNVIEAVKAAVEKGVFIRKKGPLLLHPEIYIEKVMVGPRVTELRAFYRGYNCRHQWDVGDILAEWEIVDEAKE